MSGGEQAVRGGLPSGTELGEYVIEGTIGQGGFGVVYRASHRYLGTVVALKEYLPDTVAVRTEGRVCPRNQSVAADYEEGLRRFLAEARHLVQFRSHPGVVTCVGFFEERGTAYMAMEHEEGLPLSELLTKREAAGSPLDEGELLRLAAQALESLAVVHQAGVLHRDIKPSNILIRKSDDRPVLIDFGAAKEDFVRYTKSSAPHTQGYAAIEQMEADGKLGPWTDLYGLGAVLWRIVAGGHPPSEPLVPVDALSRMAARFRGQEDPLPSVRELGAGRFSDVVLEAIDNCLELEPADRPADCAELRGRLPVLVDEEPIKIALGGSVGDGHASTMREEGFANETKLPKKIGVSRSRGKRVVPTVPTTHIGAAAVLLVLVASGLVWLGGGSDQSDTGNSLSDAGSLLESARSDSADLGEILWAAEQGNEVAPIALTLNRVYESRYTGDYVSYYDPQDVNHILPLDVTEAVEWLLEAAEQGEVQAQLWLAWMHERGLGLPRDDTKAVGWYRKAAGLGSSEAQMELASAYTHGRGVPPDVEMAVEWLLQAAEQGEVQAQLRLGSMHEEGRGLPKDDTMAVGWYRKAAELGSSDAQVKLSRAYAFGRGVPRDSLMAMEWLHKAAEQGHETAQYMLGWEYALGVPGLGEATDRYRGIVRQDYMEAAKWFRRAAEQGSARAQLELGRMYKEGQGVPIDHLRAYAWTQLAAEQEYPGAASERDSLLSEIPSTQFLDAYLLVRRIEEAIADRER